MQGCLRNHGFGIAFVTIGFLSTALRAEIPVGIAVPLTGAYAWVGENMRRGAFKAIEHLNERGGVLGEPVESVLADDFCDPEQAPAAARKLLEEDVPVVVGHPCSGAAIPASTIYDQAGIVLISPGATNPELTERGLTTSFRVVGRDDMQGAVAGDYLVEASGEQRVAIVHDGQVYGRGVAEEVRSRLRQRGARESLIETVTSGQTDFGGLVERLDKAEIDVVFFSGYMAEAGLLIRQARARLPDLQFVVPDGVQGDDFPLIGGTAIEGVLMTSFPDPRLNPAAAQVVADFRAEGFEPSGGGGTLQAYAAVEAWVEAVERAGSTDGKAVAAALRGGTFETVLGRIGFDHKGDVTGYETFVWYEWTTEGPVPTEPTAGDD